MDELTLFQRERVFRKVRKPHICSNCGRTIQPGEDAEYLEYRAPRYEDGLYSCPRQIGIFYVKHYFCFKQPCSEPPVQRQEKQDEDLLW